MEYKEYIENLVEPYYKKLIDNVKGKVEFIYEEEINKCENDNILIILNLEEGNTDIYKIIKCLQIIEKKYKILNLGFQKILDVENYSTKFLVGILAVRNENFEENKEFYLKIFSENIKNYNRIRDLLLEFKRIDSIYDVEINNISFGKTSMQYEEIFYRNLKEIINSKSKLIYKLKNGRNFSNFIKKAKGEEISNISYDIADIRNDLKNINNENNEVGKKIEDAENTPDNIPDYYDIRYELEQIKKGIFDKQFDFMVVINLENYEDKSEFIKKLNDIGANVILISENESLIKKYNCSIISDLKYLNYIFENYKYLYISEENDNNIADNFIEYSKIETLEKNEIKNMLIKEYINIFANLDNNNVVKVLSPTFLNFNGENYCAGGAERYLIDLSEICKLLGYKIRIYQYGNFEFTRFYNNIEIVGISNSKQDFDYAFRYDIMDKFNKMAIGTSSLNIYSSFLECNKKPISPSIGISHGISWDSQDNRYIPLQDKAYVDCGIIECAKNIDKMVSVDTNTSNWFQTIDFDLGNTTEYVANYVDINQFKPVKKTNKNKIIILYPRRLCKARGMYMLLDICDNLINKIDNVEIHFVGKGSKEDTLCIEEKIKQYPNNIKLYNMPPEKMYEVYQNADISLICTLHSEGTSLSCLEAMASGNAIIATRVGGLSDLIINNYNGKLIEPNKEALLNEILDFVKDKKLMEKCKKNALEVSKEFNKDVWIKKWTSIISGMINDKKFEKVEYLKAKIYVEESNLYNKKLNTLIYDLISKNYIIYIISNKDIDIKESFGKIQYINENTELYFKFDKVYKDEIYTGKVYENEVECVKI